MENIKEVIALCLEEEGERTAAEIVRVQEVAI